MNASFYRLLDRPVAYALVQHLLAPGAERIITRRITDMLAAVPEGEPLLDLGCGPTSWLSRVGLTPFGLDINPAYVAAYRTLGSPCVVASAVQIPFRDDSFGGVWSVGLLHHLPDDLVRKILYEAIRVSRGYVAILDAVTPAVGWRRPLASTIRKLDRGKFMRSEQALEALLPGRGRWDCRRFTYAATGLEMLSCIYQDNHA